MQTGQRFNPFHVFKGVFIPEAIVCVSEKELSSGAKLTYGRLLRYAGRKGVAYPKREELARQIGIELRTVDRHLKDLREFKLIESVQLGNGNCNDYYFLWHKLFDNFESSPDKSVVAEKISPDKFVVSNLSNLSHRSIEESQEESQMPRANARDDEDDDSRLEPDEDTLPVNRQSKLRPSDKINLGPLIRWAEAKGKKFNALAKQEKHISIMLRNGYTENQIKKQWDLLDSDPYWAEKGFDFAIVANEISKTKGTPKLSHGTGHISEGISLPEMRKRMEKEDAEFIRKAGK